MNHMTNKKKFFISYFITLVILVGGYFFFLFFIYAPNAAAFKKDSSQQMRKARPAEMLYDCSAFYQQSFYAVQESKIIESKQYKGKLLFVFEWRKDSPYYNEQLKSIEKLYKQLNTNQVQFMITTSNSKKMVAQFLAKNAFSLPFFIRSEKVLKLPPASEASHGTWIIKNNQSLFYQANGAQWDAQVVVDFIKKHLI